MADDSFKIYFGEDLSPVVDLTDEIYWPEVEVGGSAQNGAVGVGTLPLRDDVGSISLPVRNRVEWLHGSNAMFRGRLQAVDFTRGAQVADRTRQQSMTVDDYNIDLQGIPVDAFIREPETDVARVQGVVAAYLSGHPRATTILNGSNYVSSSNLVNLGPKTYNQTDPLGVLAEIAAETDKAFFVDVDGNLHYDGHDSMAFICPFYITDRPAEHLADDTHALTIIPNMGPTASIDGQDLSSHVRVYYTTELYKEASNAATESNHAYWADVFNIEGIDSSQAQQIANTLVARRGFPHRTYAMTVGNALGGPLNHDQIGSIKYGMMIRLKARVTPDAPDQFLWRRIADLRWTRPAPGQYFAHLRLDKLQPTNPVKGGPLGPQPPTGPVAASCATAVENMTAISTPNGNFETGLSTNWTFSHISGGVQGPAAGDWEGNYFYQLNGAGWARYRGWAGYTFLSGQNYVCRVRVASVTNDTGDFAFGHSPAGTFAGAGGATVEVTPNPTVTGWEVICIEWTPSQNVDGAEVELLVGTGAALDSFMIDDARLYTGGTGDSTGPVVGTGEGSGGTQTGTTSPIDHGHEHSNITTGGPYHMAEDVTIADAGAYFTGTTVEAGMQELGAAGLPAYSALIKTGSADPSAGAGVASGTGSIYLRTNGTLWVKFSSGDTDWREVINT